MGDELNIKVILGSTREGRFGETVARWFYAVASAREDMTTELLDLRDWPLPFLSAATPAGAGHIVPEAQGWSETIAAADGFVIVTPEYNRGYPAVLKNALDHLYREWNNKPVGFVSYGGLAGGSRAVEQLRLVAIELQMAPIREGVVLPMGRRLFNERGELSEPFHVDRANSMLTQLAWWARALKRARMAS